MKPLRYPVLVPVVAALFLTACPGKKPAEEIMEVEEDQGSVILPGDPDNPRPDEPRRFEP